MEVKRNYKLLALVLCFITSFLSANAKQGYEIKVTIKGLKDTTVILGHYLGNSMYPDDTIKLNATGSGVAKDKNALPQGVYLIYLPNTKYFDIVIGENQFFEIENDTVDIHKKVKFKNSPENEAFYKYQYFLASKHAEMSKIQVAAKDASKEEKDKLSKQMEAINTEVRQYRDKLDKEFPGTFFTKFIKATQEIEVPDFPRDSEGKVIDSLFKAKYYKAHYFDNVDISDPRMLRTPLFEERVKNYIEKVIVPLPDSIQKEVDMLIAKSRNSPELFRYMLVTLFSYYGKSQIMGYDDIAIYIADKYYIKEATWADSTQLKKLKKQVGEKMPTMLGKMSPAIDLFEVPSSHFMVAKEDTFEKHNLYIGSPFSMHARMKDYTILYFWDVDCGHCKKETPVMYEVFKNLKSKNVEVIAICLVYNREHKGKWVDFVNEHNMHDWVNCFNPFTLKHKELYDVQSTPSIFVLDKQGKILAKRLGAKQCEDLINHEISLSLKKNNNK